MTGSERSTHPTDRPNANLAHLINTQSLRCPGCQYDLNGLPGDMCPECGREITVEELLHRAEHGSPLRIVFGYAATFCNLLTLAWIGLLGHGYVAGYSRPGRVYGVWPIIDGFSTRSRIAYSINTIAACGFVLMTALFIFHLARGPRFFRKYPAAFILMNPLTIAIFFNYILVVFIDWWSHLPSII